jgi:hypothetical protein
MSQSNGFVFTTCLIWHTSTTLSTNVAGLECQNCHGEIQKMEVVEQRSTLTMGWCIDCHRKTDVNTKGNAYYDKLVEIHNKENRTFESC